MRHSVHWYMIFTSVGIIAFLITSGRRIDIRIRTPQQYEICVDTVFSHMIQHEVIVYIESLDKRLALQPSLFVSTIKKQFPVIQSIKTSLIPPGIMKVICSACNPLCVVNENLLLVMPQTICPITHFQEHVVASLPSITVENSVLQSYNPKDLISMFKMLNKNIFDQYQVEVLASKNVIFKDKKQPLLSVVCRLDSISSKNLIMYGAYMRELLEARKSATKKTKDNFIADLRFEKQIILSKK